jgi:hypothetical protein
MRQLVSLATANMKDQNIKPRPNLAINSPWVVERVQVRERAKGVGPAEFLPNLALQAEQIFSSRTVLFVPRRRSQRLRRPELE